MSDRAALVAGVISLRDRLIAEHGFDHLDTLDEVATQIESDGRKLVLADALVESMQRVSVTNRYCVCCGHPREKVWDEWYAEHNDECSLAAYEQEKG